MSGELQYEIYNKDRFAVRGDRDTYQDAMKRLGGRWNSRMRGGEGWLVPIDRESELEDLVNGASTRSTRKRYHREQSAGETESEESEEENDDSDQVSPEDSDNSEDDRNVIADDSDGQESEDDLALIDPVVVEMLAANRAEKLKELGT